jgi:periplasmic divalent cation tolerance protein
MEVEESRMATGEQLTILYVPCENEAEAARLARALLEERLVACANMWQSRSIYRWKDELKDGPETIMVLKTTPARERAARSRIRELHSYEVPCIVTLGVQHANSDYVNWVHGEVTGARLPGKAEE